MMLNNFARRSSSREESTSSASRSPFGAEPIGPAFHPPTTPGALPKPANFTFPLDGHLPLEQGLQAALPSKASLRMRFWGAVSLVLLIEVSAIQMTSTEMTSTEMAHVWLRLGAVPVAAVFGGIAGWAHVMAAATRCLPGVIREALMEMPSRYETMRRAKAEKGVQAPLWLSYAMASLMADAVWPVTTQVLRDRLGLLRWLPLRPVKRVFSSSAEYASHVIRNKHTRNQHLQSVLLTSSVTGAVETSVEQSRAGAAEDIVWDEPTESVPSHDLSDRTTDLSDQTTDLSDQVTQTSLQQAVDACIDDIERVTAADARRLWWTMTIFAALAYAAAAIFLSVAWLYGG